MKRKYLSTHEWVEFIDKTTALVGISDFAQQELGDIVFVNLPEVGDEVNAGESFAEVESVKSISDVYCPVSGDVTKVNQDLIDNPELINKDPYEAWFIEVSNITATEELMNEKEYQEYLESEVE